MIWDKSGLYIIGILENARHLIYFFNSRFARESKQGFLRKDSISI
jgi:hypothetical protein